MSDKLKCATLNVRGLNDKVKRDKVFRWIKSQNIDITFVQETFCTEDFVTLFDSCWKGVIIHGPSDSKHSRGVCIMLNDNLSVSVSNVLKSHDGRRVLANVCIENNPVTLVCVYAPNDEKARKIYFQRTKVWVDKHADNKTDIICSGDFNCCLKDQDRSSMTHMRDNSRKCMLSLIQDLELVDTWTCTNTGKNGFTFTDKRTGTKSRLDYILLSKDSCFTIQNISISVCPFVPDHACVSAILTKSQNKRGNGYWKLNCSLLEDEDYISKVKNVIYNTRTVYNICSRQAVWEMIKINVKEFSIKYSIEKAKSASNRKKQLQEMLDEVYVKMTNSCDVNLISEKEVIEKELNEIYVGEVKGAQIRSKVKWTEEGERATKYFLSLEKKRQIMNNITQLTLENGNIITNDLDILSECTRFYKSLYTSQEIDEDIIKDYVKVTHVPKLDAHCKNICDMVISEKDVFEAVKNLKTNKSPGPDGLAPEFYKILWDVVKGPYMEMLEETLVKGIMPHSMRQSVISLIYKKGDKTNIKNYRPISLSNYDYKILAFVLAKRIQSVIEKLIHENQSGYIKGRFIGLNNRLIHDIFEYCEENNVPGAIICLDYEKAYDMLEWNFMFECLKEYNFGSYITNWIKILYNDPSFIVKNNGWLSESICMKRGVRQGCPVSSLLFILCVEVMSIQIRKNPDVKGFTFNNIEHKLSQYADDTTLLLSTLLSIQTSLDIVKRFCEVSGLKVNLDKSVGIWIGEFKNNPKTYGGIIFTNKAVRCLGLYIGHDKAECYRENWLHKIEKLKNALHVWKCRKLTIYGKITILKCLGISKMVYAFSVLNVPKEIVKEVNKLVYNFVWNNTERIKRKTLINTYENGGMNMLDIECMIDALKAAWIPRMYKSKYASSFLCDQLKKNNITVKMVLDGGLTDSIKLCQIVGVPMFYANCITAFNKCKNVPLQNRENDKDYLSAPIWCNKNFTNKGKALLFKHWINSGFCWVKDLFDKNGAFLDDNVIYSRLVNKQNWLAELMIIKKTVKKYGSVYKDLSCAKYINININRITFVVNNKLFFLDDQKCKFFYRALVIKKCVRPYIEKWWEKELNINVSFFEWANIYINKVHSLPIKKISEFMYKMIHKLTVSRDILYKWKKTQSNRCPVCNEIETVKHIYYECKRVNDMWTKIGQILKVKITWKRILFGYTQDITAHRIRNLIFSIVLYDIFKLWLNSLENENGYINSNLIYTVKTELKMQTFFFKHCNMLYRNNFNNIWQYTMNKVMNM